MDRSGLPTDLTRPDVVLVSIPTVVIAGLGAGVVTTASLLTGVAVAMVVATGIVAAELFVGFPGP